MLLAACGGTAASDETEEPDVNAAAASETEGDGGGDAECTTTHEIKLSHNNVPDVPHHKGAERIGEILEEETDGRLTVKIFPQAQLGDTRDEIEQQQAGALEMAISSPAALSAFNPNAAIFAIPYAIEGDGEREQYESITAVNDSEVVTELTDEMAEQVGVRALDWAWWFGNRNITNSVRPIEAPADLDGLTLRVPDAPIHFLPIENLGAKATPLPFSELYLALQTGTVDGQENPPG